MSIISHQHWPMDFEMSSEESERLTDGLDKQKTDSDRSQWLNMFVLMLSENIKLP